MPARAVGYSLVRNTARSLATSLLVGACLCLSAARADNGQPTSPLRAGTVVRANLTPTELAAPQRAYFGLKLRNFKELQRRIEKGETLSVRQMTERYFPTPETWRSVAGWALAHGCTVEEEKADPSHMTVFATAPVARMQESLGVRFVRIVGTDGREYTSTLDTPVLPAEVVGAVAGVSQLQPHRRPRPAQIAGPPVEQLGIQYYLKPPALTQLYNAAGLVSSGTPLDGSGQTIVVIGGAKINPTDLTTFWSKCALPTTLAQFTEVDPGGLSGDNKYAYEETCDIEWSSAMAPKAKILYIATGDPSVALQTLVSQFPDDPTIHQITKSAGGSEADGDPFIVSNTQYYAALAAMGITYFASSGDAGSNSPFTNPNLGIVATTNGYDPAMPLAPENPASDPYVTAVGGTTINYAQVSSGSTYYPAYPATEGAWCLPDPPYQNPPHPPNWGSECSGGGISIQFSRPAWQMSLGGVNPSIPIRASGNMRCVPDVAAMAGGTNLVYAYFAPYGGGYQFGGTSLAAPLWAGFCALLNQARANAGLPPLGLLGPHIYPLMGTSCFHPMLAGAGSAGFSFTTTANNGAYGLGPNYNLVTGLGSPDVGKLVQALATPPPAARQVNISTRGQVNGGDAVVIAGFVVNGPSGLTKQFLLRAVGPTLGTQGIGAPLAQPTLTLFDAHSQPIASNTGWGHAPVASASTVSGSFAAAGIAVRSANAGDMASVGAFALPTDATTGTPTSADSAMVAVLPPGAYTMVVGGAGGGTGIALAEVYELNTTDPTHLVNLSSRAFVGTGEKLSIAGLVSTGTQSGQWLIRAVGPTLAAMNVSGPLAQPTLTLVDSQQKTVAINTGWGHPPVAGNSTLGATIRAATAADMATVGAFALPAGSADSAMVVTLPPGAYTALVTGADGGTGIALVESYQMNAGQ